MNENSIESKNSTNNELTIANKYSLADMKSFFYLMNATRYINSTFRR